MVVLVSFANVDITSFVNSLVDDDDSVDLTVRFNDFVNSPNCFRAFNDVSLASSNDWAVLSRCGRRFVKLKIDQDVNADCRGDISLPLLLLDDAMVDDIMAGQTIFDLIVVRILFLFVATYLRCVAD